MTSDVTESVFTKSSEGGRTELSPVSDLPFCSVAVSSCATLAPLPTSMRDQAGECSIGSCAASRSRGSRIATDVHHAHQHDGEREDDDQQQKRRGGGAAHIERGERVLPDRIRDRLGSAARATAGEDV